MIHDPLPIAVESHTTYTYTVGCSCGWQVEDSVEAWAKQALDGHLRAHDYSAFRCEWAGDRQGCKEPVAGYAGGPRNQHPLCAKHLAPKLHPPDMRKRLHLGEPITDPCAHDNWASASTAPGGES